MSNLKFFGWCFLVLGPTPIGLLLVRTIRHQREIPGAGFLESAWLCYDVFSGVAAGIWLMQQVRISRFWRVVFGCVIGLFLAVLNVVLIFFTSCTSII